jgi:hypothetical protein
VCVGLEFRRLTFDVEIWAIEGSETNIINRFVMFIQVVAMRNGEYDD